MMSESSGNSGELNELGPIARAVDALERGHSMLRELNLLTTDLSLDYLHERNALRAENAALKAQWDEMDTYGCPDCNGDGEIHGWTCLTCNGHGVLFTKPKEATSE